MAFSLKQEVNQMLTVTSTCVIKNIFLRSLKTISKPLPGILSLEEKVYLKQRYCAFSNFTA